MIMGSVVSSLQGEYKSTYYVCKDIEKQVKSCNGY